MTRLNDDISGSPANSPDASIARDRAVAASFPRNAAAIVAFDVIWDFGASCCPLLIAVPAYLFTLGASKTAVQVVTVLMSLMMALQVFSGKLIHGPRRRQRLFGYYLVWPLCWILFGVTALAGWGRWPGEVWTPLFLGIVGVITVMNAFTSPAFMELTLDAVPLRRRGRLVGLRTLCGGLAGVAGAALVTWLMGLCPSPTNFHVCFVIGPIFMAASCWTVLFIRDHGPAIGQEGPPPGVRKSLRSLLSNRRFVVFLAFFSIMTAAQAMSPLVIGYGRDVLGMPAKDSGLFSLTWFAGMIAVGLIVPLLADRWGFKLIAVIDAILLLAGWVMPLAIQDHVVGTLISYGLLCGVWIMNTYVLANLGVEIAAGVRPAATIAIGSILGTFPSLLAGPIGGWIVDRMSPNPRAGYQIVFLIAAGMGLVALAGYAFAVREPRVRVRSVTT